MPRNPVERELLEQFAAALRVSRRSARWTQQRLARELGTSQSSIARMERGQMSDVGIATASRALRAVGGRLDARFAAATGAAAPQRDRAHARCVAHIAGRLARSGWQVAAEVQVEAGRGRWRSFVDVLALHPRSRVALAVEVKTEIRDVGEIDRQLGIGERGAWDAARHRGWRPRAVIPALLVLSTRENDARLLENRAYLAMRLPARANRLQALVDGDELVSEELSRGAVAMVDPRSRRTAWLLPLQVDGRRTPTRYESREAYLAPHP